jgi:uncharacterized protein (UPF0332 family)
MKFIDKLIKEERIRFVEPSSEIAQSYLEKSSKSLISAKTLQQIHNFDDAVALTYYSMYYSGIALLYMVGIKCENHTGTIILLKDVFEIDNTSIIKAKKERVDKQYYVDFNATDDDVKEGIIVAEAFNSVIKEIIDRMNNNQMTKFREGFKKRYMQSVK